MKISKKFAQVFVFACFSLFSSIVYAGPVATTTSNVKVETAATTTSNVKVETVKKDDKKVETVVSEDKYVRITQPTKEDTSTFDNKMNIAGETTEGTKIVIEVYNTSLDKEKISLPKDAVVYELSTIGVTKSFNQIVDLLEGENKIVLIYTNEKDKKNKEKIIFNITRLPEQTKEAIKNAIVYPGKKD